MPNRSEGSLTNLQRFRNPLRLGEKTKTPFFFELGGRVLLRCTSPYSENGGAAASISLGEAQYLVHIHAGGEDMQNNQNIRVYAIENQIIAMHHAAHAPLPLTGNKRICQRHRRQRPAARFQFLHERECPRRVIFGNGITNPVQISPRFGRENKPHFTRLSSGLDGWAV